MPARTDHDRRDAQHWARLTIGGTVQQYQRRLVDFAYAHIEEEATKHDGTGYVDWAEVGRLAAAEALASYGISVGTTPAAIDGHASPALEAGADQDANT